MYIENRSFILKEDSTIIDVISNLNDTGYLICVITGQSDELLGTITDGDIRRGLLDGKTLADSATQIMVDHPIFAYVDSTAEQNKNLITQHKIKQLPIVDQQNRIQALYIPEGDAHVVKKNNPILIMAGGFGKRMLPLTADVPKPMLEISGKPILEHIICNARSQGFYSFFISIHYLGEKIIDYFGDGSKWDVQIEYLKEDQPLGTAGCLTLFDSRPDIPFIVTNGDLFSDINFSSILNFHDSNNAAATMAVKRQQLQNPFGVVTTEGAEIVNIEEKPINTSYVNSGVYVLDPNNLNLLPQNSYFDMPDFFMLLKNNSKKIVAFPIHESWEDVGRPLDLQKVNKLEN
ncbi:nucleotidyltransferase family protein [Gammaproteobacteria bacterium]|nr:nucleotidyltransferase family protein [Gammaproteobacteria bacterium]